MDKARLKKAYGGKGLGMVDLIPGVRDLPTPLRFVLMVVCVCIFMVLLWML